MEALICHLIGDYVLQSDWMAARKRASLVAATAHALTYSLPFLLLEPSLLAWWVIMATHAAIDHLGLARYVVFAKNFLAPRAAWPEWSKTDGTGYGTDKPIWLTTWLYIIADNTMHITINYLALRYL
jgi:hypothetical protein